MGYVDENLMSDESIVYSAKLHPFVFVLPVVLLLIGVFVAFSGRGAQEFACVSALGTFLIIGAALLLLVRLIEYSTSEFAVTTKRVIVKVGFIRRRTLELLLQKVETVGVDQPILGRLFGFGTILVSGTGGTQEPFRNISDPLEFRRRVQDQTSRSSPSAAVSAQQAPSSSSPPMSSGGPFCTNCGVRNTADSKFCSACGTKLA